MKSKPALVSHFDCRENVKIRMKYNAKYLQSQFVRHSIKNALPVKEKQLVVLYVYSHYTILCVCLSLSRT